MHNAKTDLRISDDSEVERYELREAQRYHFAANRREFAQTLGAGLLVAVAATDARAKKRQKPTPRRKTGRAISSRRRWRRHRFDQQGRGRQGSRTQITQAAAEELRMPIDRVQLIMADSAQCPDDGGTAGSRTTPSTVPRVRASAAALRQLLKEHAADHFGVTADQVEIVDGSFRTSNQQSLTIADFAVSQTLLDRLAEATAAEDAPIAAVKDWSVLGTPVAKIRAREIVTGSAIYPSDIRRPDMLYGKVVRPPAYGATLRAINLDGVDTSDAVIVRDGDFLGCASRTSWKAGQVRDALRVAVSGTGRRSLPARSCSITLSKLPAAQSDPGTNCRQPWPARRTRFEVATPLLTCNTPRWSHARPLPSGTTAS